MSLSFCFLLFTVSVSAQDYSLHTEEVKDSLISDKGKDVHSLFIGTGYGSNMIYLGSTISQNKPYGYASLTYGLLNKIYLSATAVHLMDMKPLAAFYTGSANISHTFNSWLDVSAGISRYEVQKSLTDTIFKSFTYGDITLGIDWKILYTRLSVSKIFSAENGYYFQIKNSRYFQTPEFSKKKLYFSFEPYSNLIFGTLIRSETSNGTSVVNASPPFRKHGQSGSQSASLVRITKVQGLIELDFGTVVSFNTPFFTIEAEPGYIYPLYEDVAYPGSKGFLFLLSAFIKIF